MNDKKKYRAKLAELESQRSYYLDLWKDLTKSFRPSSGAYLVNSKEDKPQTYKAPINNTPLIAVKTLGAGLQSGITSPARRWLKLSFPNPSLQNDKVARKWLEDCSQIILNELARSNFYQVSHNMYENMGIYGVDVMIIDELDTIGKSPLNFKLAPIGSYCLAENNRGVCDTLYRKITMTVKELVQEFGIENISKRSKRLHDKGMFFTKIDVIHIVEPNIGRKYGSLSVKDKPFKSCYFEEASSKDDGFLRISGFDEQPFIAPRWDKNDTPYGVGPGVNALGDAKSLEAAEIQMAEAIEKQVNPALIGPTSLANTDIRTDPGTVTFMDTIGSGSSQLQPLHTVNPDTRGLRDNIITTENRIKTAMFENLFMMISSSDRRNRTATEIDSSNDEKAFALGPVLERFHHEGLDPLIDRVFNILLRRNFFGEIPAIVKEFGADIEFSYESSLSQKQKAIGIANIERVATWATNMANIDPGVLDTFDALSATRIYADRLGAPQDLLRSEDEVSELQKARQEKQNQAEQMQIQSQQSQQFSQAAQAAKTMSETNTGGDSNAIQTLQQLVAQ